jgi:hypothetical protein
MKFTAVVLITVIKPLVLGEAVDGDGDNPE